MCSFLLLHSFSLHNMRSFRQSEKYSVFLQILASKYISNIIIIFEYICFGTHIYTILLTIFLGVKYHRMLCILSKI